MNNNKDSSMKKDPARGDSSLDESELLRVKAIENSIPSFVVNSNHEIVIWNYAMEKASGLSKEEMIGTTDSWKAFYPEERDVLADIVLEGKDPHDLYDQVKKSVEVPEGYSARGEATLKGEEVYILFTAAPIQDSNNKIIGAVENIQDITEIRELKNKAAEAWRTIRSL